MEESFRRNASSSPQPFTEGRLDSWKEIAAFLKRSVSTVQRWERTEGLPVHRHMHSKLGTVYAYKAEIDAWWSARQPELEAEEASRAGWWRARAASPWASGALAAILFVALAGVYVAWGGSRQATSPVAERIMLAVLPFDDLSGDPEQVYFADGLTEELITELGGLNPERLGVVARTSVMAYKETKKTIREIGSELGVDYILEGSVRRQGERVRISAQLIRVSDQTHLWAESFDRDVREILDWQKDVAENVARRIRVELKSFGTSDWARRVPPEAREAYLKGLFFWNKRTHDDLYKAIAYFQQALQLEPRYAPAYVGLASSFVLMPAYGDPRSHEDYPKARQAALRALEIDNTLGEARAVLAVVKHDYEYDQAGAEREYRQAIELSPNYATAYQWYAEYLTHMGRFEEAYATIQQAGKLDPLSPIINSVAGWVLFYARRYDEAIAQLTKTLEMHPDFLPAHIDLARSYEAKEMWEEARAHYAKALGGPPRHFWVTDDRILSDGDSHDGSVLKEIEEMAQRGEVWPYQAARFYIARGDHRRALAWLEKGYEQRDPSMVNLEVDLQFDTIRAHPEMQDLLRRLGLPLRSEGF